MTSTFLAVIFLLLLAAGWYLKRIRSRETAPDAAELQAGFEILHQSLHGLSQLNKLLLLKTVTFRRPPDVIADLMRDVASASRDAHRHLRRWMKEAPAVSIQPVPGLGTDIRNAATERNRAEILGHPAQFELRFLTAQLQALLMVGIVAEQTARYDPNDARSAWLHDVAEHFLTLREAAFDTLESGWDKSALHSAPDARRGGSALRGPTRARAVDTGPATGRVTPEP